MYELYKSFTVTLQENVYFLQDYAAEHAASDHALSCVQANLKVMRQVIYFCSFL